MPYELETNDGIILRNIPDNVQDGDPRLKALVEKERTARKERSPEFKAQQEAQKQAEQQQKETQERERYARMGPLEKGARNVGAGLETAWQGFRQIAPGFKTPTDEEVRELRTRNKRLAESTELGIGADWMPSIGSALQFAGEVAPTLLIPGGAAGAGARVGGTVLRRALMGAGGGAASGAISPVTSDESRGMNVALGAGMGAALPAAIAARQASRGITTAEGRAGRKLSEIAGDDAPDIAQAVRQREAERQLQSRAVRDIPETLSAASGSTRIARLENQLGRDAATADEISALQNRQNVARYEAVQRATNEAPLLERRAVRRDAATDPMRTQALQAAGQDPWFHEPVVRAVQGVLSRPASVNPSVQRVADEVMRNIDQRAQTAITPERLYEVRKLLADKLSGPAQVGDELSNAVKGANRETMQLIRAIDDALDTSSGGQFSPYLAEHSARSRPVDAARAARTVRESFDQFGTEMKGGAPLVSRPRLSRAVLAAEERQRKFPLELSQRAFGDLEGVMGGLQRAEDVQKATLGGAHGNSRTSADIESVLQRLAKGTTGIPGLSHVIEAFTSRASDATKMELARLIQNPQQAVAAIQRARLANRPLTEAEELLVSAVSTGLGALPAEATEGQ